MMCRPPMWLHVSHRKEPHVVFQTRRFPSLEKEGWTRPQEKYREATFFGERTGWFVQLPINRWLEPTTLDAARCRACASPPSARANVASRNLLDRAANP